MAKLDSIVNRFATLVAAQTGIETFLFDDLSGINKAKNQSYPVLHLTPPDSVITNVLAKGVHEDYTIDLYLYDVYHQQEQNSTTLQAKWTALKDELIQMVRSFPDTPTYGIMPDTPVTVVIDRFAHNDKLIFAKASFIVRINSCY